MSVQAAGSLRAFLASAKKCLQNGIAKQERVNLVIGNESADLDSCISSILFAYLRSQSQTPSGSPYIPLLNIPRADIRIRAELLKLLPHANLEPEHLITLDDLPPIEKARQELKPENTHWCLVDHNALQGPLGDIYASRVFGCIDHHVEENKVPKETGDEPRIIKPTGSCTSLVINHFRDTWESLSRSQQHSKTAKVPNGNVNGSADATDRKTLDAQMAKFALASILVDTSDLRAKDKVTDEDEKAVEYLEGKVEADTTAEGKFDRRKFYKQINKAKKDVEGMSLDDLLRKDYKQWTEGKIKIGISSVVASLTYMVSKTASSSDSPEAFLKDLKSFAAARQLDILVVMTKSTSDSGVFQKEILLYQVNPSTGSFAERFAKSTQAELQLESWKEHRFPDKDLPIKVWWQRNVEKSRKQVAPMLRETANV